jgi:hypothetical protein
VGRYLRLFFVLTLAWVCGAAACQGCGETVTACAADADCQAIDPFLKCDLAFGTCACTDDRACGPDEFCNVVGRCQPVSGCLSNKDCPASGPGECEQQFCDTTSGQCKGVCECGSEPGDICCTLDSQCGYGSVCDAFAGRCVDGCRNDGDCRLGEGCVGSGLGGTLGECAAGVCTGDNLCGFGELCNIESGECTFDARGPYCFGCAGGLASDDCGNPANYCLVDTTDPTRQSSFCGVDCNAQEPCPFGYTCSDVIVVGPPFTPQCGAEACVLDGTGAAGFCSFNTAVSCESDADCPIGLPGGDCPRGQTGHCLLDQETECTKDSDCCEDPTACPEGSCLKQVCSGGEGDAFGFCSCTKDTDCPRDECVGADMTDPLNPIQGNCRLSGHRCYEEIDCDVISCVDGGCRIGANCAPANDRSCRELIGANE